LFKGSRHKRFQNKIKKRSEKERKKEKKKKKKKKKKTEFRGAPRSGSQDNQVPG